MRKHPWPLCVLELFALAACLPPNPETAAKTCGPPTPTASGVATGPSPVGRMAHVPEATFQVGSNTGEPDERPAHRSAAEPTNRVTSVGFRCARGASGS